MLLYNFMNLIKQVINSLTCKGRNKHRRSIHHKVKSLFDVVLEKVVPPEVFYPPPEVESALVSFKRHNRFGLDSEGRKHLSTMVRLLFNQRRKQIGKLLGRITGSKDSAAEILQKCGFSTELRPDKLTVDDFIRLANAVADAGVTHIAG